MPGERQLKGGHIARGIRGTVSRPRQPKIDMTSDGGFEVLRTTRGGLL